MMVDEWGVTYCKNCGHESHCGTNKMAEHRGYSVDGAIMGMIEVCKSCRCEKCKQPDWG
jgi:hypothetical protein